MVDFAVAVSRASAAGLSPGILDGDRWVQDCRETVHLSDRSPGRTYNYAVDIISHRYRNITPHSRLHYILYCPDHLGVLLRVL